MRGPAGEKAIHEIRLAAIGLLYCLFGEEIFSWDLPLLQSLSEAERRGLPPLLKQRLNAPLTSSAGRLFDAVASLLDVRQRVLFEGQAAMELEGLIPLECSEQAHYPCPLVSDHRENDASSPSPMQLTLKSLIEALLADRHNGVPTSVIAARFHNTLVEAIVAVARKMEIHRVVLSGGCFQNLYLTERTIQRLKEEGFEPYWHKQTPPNDGGLALGQVIGALARRDGKCV